MKISDWQSGTIAPNQPGVYHRRELGYEAIELGRWDGYGWWVISQKTRLRIVSSSYQISNGHLWQWRGRIEE